MIDVMPVALVIADSNWVVNDVRSALTFGDWDVEALTDPRQASSAVTESRPDVVIIDMQVHSMGGMAIVRAVRAAFQDSPPPRMVLLLDRSADRFIAKRARADAWVVKAFVASELRNAVRVGPSNHTATSSAGE